jgi:chromosome segregation ATPase
MVVTADPLGDFNATSQILRYSALAREVTVPRVPSITATMLAGTAAAPTKTRASSGALQEELETALAAIASLREDLEMTQLRLDEETRRRQEAEMSWQAAESRMYEIEAEVREEVWSEMEAQMALEQRRWRAARDEELDRNDEHMDRKLELMARGIDLYASPSDDKENAGGEDGGRVAELEDEVGMLKERLAATEREKESQRSPSKKMRVLKSRRWDGSGMGVDEGF